MTTKSDLAPYGRKHHGKEGMSKFPGRIAGLQQIEQTLVAYVIRFRKPLAIAVAAFLISHVDPLGIDDATGARARDTIMRLSSTLFPPSELVTVVLIDQKYVELQPSRSWPLSYGSQGVLLRQIADRGPSAVFVDLLYKNPHRNAPHMLAGATAATDNPMNSTDGLDVPGDLLDPIKDSKVPFYFAALPLRGGVRGQTDEFDLDSFAPAIGREGIFKQPLERRLAVVSWTGYDDYYPLRLEGRRHLRTPAYALYEQYCEASRDPSCEEADQYQKSMLVRWGAFVPAKVMDHLDDGLCQYMYEVSSQHQEDRSYPGLWLRTRALLRQLGLAVADRAGESKNPDSLLPCMPFTVLPASLLANPKESRNEALIDAALNGAYVFVGAQIPGIPDLITSPVQGQVAGVMLHAMAMQNLLKEGSGYVRATPVWFVTLVKLVILCAVAVWAATHPPRQSGRWHTSFVVISVLAWLGCAAFCFAQENTARGMLFLMGGALITWLAPADTGKVIGLSLIVCVSALLMIEVGREPTNWIALAIAASLVYQIASRSQPDESDAPSIQITQTQTTIDVRLTGDKHEESNG